jgi:hypothetical protein
MTPPDAEVPELDTFSAVLCKYRHEYRNEYRQYRRKALITDKPAAGAT